MTESAKPYSLSDAKTTSIPFIKADVGYFMEKTEVEFDCKTDNVEIRYTLDGTEPTQKSILFKHPFSITKSMIIKARAFKEGLLPGNILSVKAVKAEFLKSSKVDNLINGVSYKYVEKKFSSAYEIEKANIIKTGTLITSI